MNNEQSELKKYKCHKVVDARPMTNVEHMAHTGRLGHDAPMPIEVDGYLVIYSDKYESWSPKKAFDEGYLLVPESYRCRVKIELEELKEKAEKLNKFVWCDNDNCVSLDNDEKALLIMQMHSQQVLIDVLQERVDRFDSIDSEASKE